MIRTLALLAVVLLAGCARYQHPRDGLLGRRSPSPPPPPYGATTPQTASQAGAPKPAGNQPLGFASAAPAPPLPPDDRPLIPAAGTTPDSDSPALPPRRRPEPQPGSLPSPFAPKDPATPAPARPGAENVAAKNLAELKALVATAAGAWKAVDTYEATVTRRELNPKGQMNNEVVIFQFRKEPLAVYTRNVGDNGRGRETVYNPGKYGDKLHVVLGKGDPFPGAGFVAPPISPDDRRVKEKARYSIRAAGFGTTIAKLQGWVTALEAGTIPADSLTFDGPVTRAEYPYPLVGVTHKMRMGDDPHFPDGGTKLYFFDMKRESPSYGLPVLAVGTDAAGKEVEYYLFEKIKLPAKLTDADFNPERLGKKK